jgi:histidinol-phosphate aminotransferase
MSTLDLVRPDLRALRGYSSARMEASGGKVLLNANESPWIAAADPIGLNRYPEPQPATLLAALGALYGVAPDALLVGRGSDEGIDLLTRALCRAGQDAVLIAPPTFGMYRVSAEIQGAGVLEVPLESERGFAYSFEAVAHAALDAPVKLVYVCSPNNPTGSVVANDAIRALAQRLAGRALVVVDEAYGEFATQDSLAVDAAGGANLVVLRTLSKAHGLASARIGSLIAAPELIAFLRRLMAPYPLPQPCVDAALRVLTAESLAATRLRIAALRAGRDRLANALSVLPNVRRVLPSEANFVTACFADAGAVYRSLLGCGIVVRDVSRYPGLAGHLRITIGTEAEIDAVLAALAAFARAA